MNFKEAIFSALDSLLAHKLRSFLTLLGIIAGMTTLMAVMTLIEGANAYVSDKIADLSPDVFQVSQFPRVIINFNEYIKALKWKRIKYEDYMEIKRRSTECKAVGAASMATDLVKRLRQYATGVTIRGVTASMANIERKEIEDGRYFDEQDMSSRRQVCILGADIVEHLFVNEDPIGKDVTIGGRKFVVIGTMKKIGSVFGNSRDQFVLIPITTLFKLYGSQRSVAIYCQAPSRTDIHSALEEVRGILRSRRHVPQGKPDDFSITTADTIIGIYHTITSAFFLVTIIIAAISLLVGGVVIMNIMLVSVRERTREIGIRKAIGARPSDIRTQFLVEAVILCLSGGACGILAGISVAKIIEALTPFPANIRLSVIAIGFLTSMTVGLFFGIYPASRAARMDPIECLRYE